MPAADLSHAVWGSHTPSNADTRSAWLSPLQFDRAERTTWAAFDTALGTQTDGPWLRAGRADDKRGSAWGVFDAALLAGFGAGWKSVRIADAGKSADWFGNVLVPSDDIAGVPWVVSAQLDTARVLPWSKYSRQINPGWGIVIPEEPVDPVDPSPVATLIVPVRKVYMQVNTVTFALLDTGQEIPAKNLSLSIDADSWCWGWSANVPVGYLAVLQTVLSDFVEVVATVNGVAFRLSVERIRSDRPAPHGLTISGRGRALWLDAPKAKVATRSNSGARTAQQLMASALTENGASLGWGIDWQITDWLVPAGSWFHTGTPIEACLAIAGAAGAYIQADRYNQTLAVLPRYPSAPWGWGSVTPDLELPEDVCTVESIEWVDKPNYNTVFVAGQINGVLAHVTRAGSDGSNEAPMETDPLITHATAGGQRGLSILANTGRQKLITLSLPVLSTTGIIFPGKMVRYVENGKPHIGITRGVEVSQDFPKVRQSIQIESHVL